jgi:hypothetical protein
METAIHFKTNFQVIEAEQMMCILLFVRHVLNRQNNMFRLTLLTIILSITTPNFALKILKAFLLGDMNSIPLPQTFFFKELKIIDFKNIELPLLNR